MSHIYIQTNFWQLKPENIKYLNTKRCWSGLTVESHVKTYLENMKWEPKGTWLPRKVTTCYLSEAKATALQQQAKKTSGMKTRGSETRGEANMPGQNMLSWVYPLAFTLLQIYFPPAKFFMRRHWLCSMVMLELLHSGAPETPPAESVATWLTSTAGMTKTWKGLLPKKVSRPDFSPRESPRNAVWCYATIDIYDVDVYLFES